MFADLRSELDALPEVAIVAVGGIPIVLHRGQHQLFGRPVTAKNLREALRDGLGLGAVLTYRNPNDKTLDQLAQVCLEHDHLWTAHVLMLTVAFARCPLAVRNAFAFDRRFHLSWVDSEVSDDPCTFTATGSLREWARMMGYADAPSFKAEPRAWFAKVADLLGPLLA
ncbi:MAG: hypothetical protein K0V04_15975 [Deltaproteobacteria bacterium]|nr:hypothetical protein [Deltaproteobacteria bacterium]